MLRCGMCKKGNGEQRTDRPIPVSVQSNDPLLGDLLGTRDSRDRGQTSGNRSHLGMGSEWIELVDKLLLSRNRQTLV
jgi:hypothetical protein